MIQVSKFFIYCKKEKKSKLNLLQELNVHLKIIKRIRLMMEIVIQRIIKHHVCIQVVIVDQTFVVIPITTRPSN